MSATDELRRMLDERGVEYFRHEDDEPLRKLEKAEEPATSWRMGGASVCAVPIEGGELFDLWIDHCTPEQAIAATLDGNGKSRWNELFGTPERAAQTLETYLIEGCAGVKCGDCPFHSADSYYMDCRICERDGRLLEWLRGDA